MFELSCLLHCICIHFLSQQGPEILGIVFAFIREDDFDQVVTDVGPVTHWGMFPPNEDKRICSQHNEYAIPFYKFRLSLIGYCLPYNDFNVN